MTKTKTKTNQTGTFGKVMMVLDVIADSPSPIRFTEIMSLLDEPRGSIHRHLSHLLQEGLVVQNADGNYELGIRLLQLASKSWQKNNLRDIAEPYLNQLQEKFSETVHLAVLQGSKVVYLDKVESNQSIRMHSQIGNTSPIYCTGVGKAMFSALSDQKIDELMPEIDFHTYTEFTLKNETELRDEIMLIRKQHYAEDREEHEMGIRCVAAPIVDKQGKVLGGISITSPAYRIKPETIEEWKVSIPEIANLIGESCSDQLSPSI